MAAAAAVLLLCLTAAAARELDPAACAARFDVQRDKIIRTEESRDMGARYLSELDVGSRPECLRLCCETDACDVFVYEEKSAGSCYLFACGPPEDFRCKFTAHANFSAGVLAWSRRLLELQDAERAPALPAPPAPPAPHAPPAPPAQPQPRSTTSTTTTTTAPSPSPPPAPPRPPPALPSLPAWPADRSHACSRYEFACRHGGECIAVYNACDGVPQCADGSDEAPELGCPPRAPPAPPRAVPPAPEPAPAPAPWPHRLAQAQPRHHYTAPEDNSVHIFSHTGGLLQAPAPAWHQQRPRPPPASHAQRDDDENKIHILSMEPMEAGSVGAAEGAAWEGGGDAWEPRRAWPVPPPPPRRLDLQEVEFGRTMPELPPVFAAPGAPHDAPKKAPPALPEPRAPLAPPAPPALPAAPEPTAPPPPLPEHPVLSTTERHIPLHKKVAAVDSASRAAAVAAAAVAAGDAAPWGAHDGLSERAPAALLLLVLGVALTGAVVAALGCGRAARRRRRRAPHASDYLVNGMYL